MEKGKACLVKGILNRRYCWVTWHMDETKQGWSNSDIILFAISKDTAFRHQDVTIVTPRCRKAVPIKILDKIVNIPFTVWWAFLCLICMQRLYLMIRSFTGIRCFTFVRFGPWLQIGVDECMFRVYQITSLGPGSAIGKRSSPMFNSLRSLFFSFSRPYAFYSVSPFRSLAPGTDITLCSPLFPHYPSPDTN